MDQKASRINGIQSFERGIFILDEIKKTNHSITLTELAHKTSMTKSSLQRYLISFVKVGVLSLDEENKTYNLGPKLIELGLHALNNRLDIVSIIEPFLYSIKKEYNQSSALAVWTDKGPMIVKYQKSGKAINVKVEVGFNPPLLISSIGKCFAAFLPTHLTSDIFDKEVTKYELNKKLVLEELAQIKNKGVAIRDAYVGDLPGSLSISSPIFDHSGKIIAVLGLVGFANDFNVQTDSNEPIWLKEMTTDISKELGYTL